MERVCVFSLPSAFLIMIRKYATVEGSVWIDLGKFSGTSLSPFCSFYIGPPLRVLNHEQFELPHAAPGHILPNSFSGHLVVNTFNHKTCRFLQKQLLRHLQTVGKVCAKPYQIP